MARRARDAITPVGWVVLGVLIAALALWRSARLALRAPAAGAEQVRELVKRKVDRPNVFSHEVRTPLTLIKGVAELAE